MVPIGKFNPPDNRYPAPAAPARGGDADRRHACPVERPSLRDALHSVKAQADQGQCVASGAYGANDRIDFAPPLTGSIAFFSAEPLSANPLEPSALVIQRATVIRGPGSLVLALSCSNVAARLLEVDAGAGPVSLDGVTIANCQAKSGPGGGVFVAAILGRWPGRRRLGQRRPAR